MKTDLENKKPQFYKGGESFVVDFCGSIISPTK